MRLDTLLQTPRLLLRTLREEDVTERYVGWLNDPEVARFLEVRFSQHSLASTVEFVNGVNASTDTLLLGMFVDGGGKHIGNIKLGPINPHHHRADIGLLIGDRSEWGKGYATEAITLITAHGFASLKLKKITAGCYSGNQGSLKAFEKAGFKLEATLPEHWATSTGPQDEFLMGLTAERYASRVSGARPRRFGGVKKLVLIGGGDLMVETASVAREYQFAVTVIMAPRHAEETLPLSGGNARDACLATGAEVVVMEDINQPGALAGRTWSGAGALALCFGPAWIFSADVISSFGAGMINFNGIPVPHYLGGAHYTWQILNGNRQGGCFLQAITSRIDRGDILRAQKFDLPPEVATPHDYFAANHRLGCRFLREALADFKADREFVPIAFAQVNADRLYFPRLLTRHNAFIDWAWTGSAIAAFCQAFDDPYPGATTFVGDRAVRLKKVRLDPAATFSFHPYVSGLVVRKLGRRLWVGVTDGLLQIELVVDDAGVDAIESLREGDRFATPPEALHRCRTFVPKVSAK